MGPGAKFRRAVTAVVGALGLALPVALDAAPASAEIGLVAEDVWGVYGVADTYATNRIVNQVFAIEQIGNRVFVAGKFTEARPWAGGVAVPQPYLAAFDLATGRLVESFRPQLNGAAYALATSPDGSRLFVGGEFRSVNGVNGTEGLAAIDPNTGAVAQGWLAQLDRRFSDNPAIVFSLDADAEHLYVGGSFDSVGGRTEAPQLGVARVTKLRLADGAPDREWRPNVQGGSVWAIDVSPDGRRVHIGGYHTSVNGSTAGAKMATVDNVAGALVPGLVAYRPNSPTTGYVQDIESVGDLVFAAGAEHVLWVFDAATMSVRTQHTTGDRSNIGAGGD
jgi:large repetitive protein